MALTPQQLVDREVIYCMSALVSELATSYGMEEANDLFNPTLDYESALIDEGFMFAEDRDCWISPDQEEFPGMDAEEVCDIEGIEPYEREIYEHWLVSPWLGRKLEAMGERVDLDFHGLCIWGRTTTGQAIYMDECIQSLCS